MTELSLKEKAKRYDEAIERVENIKTGKCKTTFMFTEGLFEHIFPELKESVDDRIDIEVWKAKNGQWILKLNNKIVRGEWYNDAECIYKHFFYLSEIKSLIPQNTYNPYKAVVESIAAMVEKYASFDSNLQDFYDNVKVKCKDAKEYDSLFPQSQWKPSYEQMEALLYEVNAWDENSVNGQNLRSLYQDLKKLREE